MRIAILIQCHKNSKQINLLLERLNHPDIDCYLHIDKKADFTDKIIHRENVFVLPDEKRVAVKWAQISQVPQLTHSSVITYAIVISSF